MGSPASQVGAVGSAAPEAQGNAAKLVFWGACRARQVAVAEMCCGETHRGVSLSWTELHGRVILATNAYMRLKFGVLILLYVDFQRMLLTLIR